VDEAIPHLERAVDSSPKSAELQNDLGTALAQRGRIEDAIPHFELALQIEPKMVRARYYLGVALVTKGQVAQGLAQWRGALRDDPDNIRVLNDAAWLLATSPDAGLRNGGEAMRLATHAAQLTSEEDPSILATLAAAYAEAGEFAKAMASNQQAINLATQQGKADLAATLKDRMASFQKEAPIREK
jgi:Flp pilus assembly protein TadD